MTRTMSACCLTRSANEPASAMKDESQCSAVGLRLQIDDGDGRAAAIFGFGVKLTDERMRGKKFGKAAAKRARAVAVNDADARQILERGGIEEFIDAARGFFDRAADDVDFERGWLVGARGVHGDVTLRRCSGRFASR